MQSLVQEFPQRVFGIFKEQTVVAKRRHGNGDLSEVVEILQYRTLQKNHQSQVTSTREEWEGGKEGRSIIRGQPGVWAVSVQVPSQAQVPQGQNTQSPPSHHLNIDLSPALQAPLSLGLPACQGWKWLQTGVVAQGRKVSGEVLA